MLLQLVAELVIAEPEVLRRAALVERWKAASRDAEDARGALLDAFAELKRFEISLERRRSLERLERGRREQEGSDEAAINGHRRRAG